MRQKYYQTLLLANNWMIRGIQAHSGIATLVTQHILVVTFLCMHYSVRYKEWALLDAVTLFKTK